MRRNSYIDFNSAVRETPERRLELQEIGANSGLRVEMLPPSLQIPPEMAQGLPPERLTDLNNLTLGRIVVMARDGNLTPEEFLGAIILMDQPSGPSAPKPN